MRSSWHPATDWRDTGIVLEWLYNKEGLILLRNDERFPGEAEAIKTVGKDANLQRAICAAAIAVGETFGGG